MDGSSGFGSEGSALKAFFESIKLPNDNSNESDDLSIDLNQIEMAKHIAIRQPSPIQPPPVKRKLDPLIEDLQIMRDQLGRNSSYSQRVTKIMLEGLKNDFPHLYQPFITRNLPPNYIPIIKFNDLNTPYVEFLLKAGHSDEIPTSQLIGIRDEHLAFSKVLVDQLLDKVTTARHSTPRKQSSGQSLLAPAKNGNESLDCSASKRSLPRRKCRESNSSYRV